MWEGQVSFFLSHTVHRPTGNKDLSQLLLVVFPEKQTPVMQLLSLFDGAMHLFKLDNVFVNVLVLAIFKPVMYKHKFP